MFMPAKRRHAIYTPVGCQQKRNKLEEVEKELKIIKERIDMPRKNLRHIVGEAMT